MAEKNIGSLAQKYAQIIMGFLTQAIIQFQAMQKEQENKKQPESLIIQPGSVQALISKIDSAFGDLKLDSGLQKQSQYPLIFWQDLALKIKNYLKTHDLPLQWRVFMAVINDLIKMKILVPSLALKQDLKNPLYEINTDFFNRQQIEHSSLTLKEALEQKLFKVIGNEVAREILMHMALIKSFSDEDANYFYKNFPQTRGIIFMTSRFGRGYLLTILHKKGIKYRPFMETVTQLVSHGILIEGCDEISQEFLILNPLLKPFSVIAEIISALKTKEQQTNIVEVESSQESVTPLGGMISINSLNPASQDIFLFDGFEFGLQGL
ncbi:MAG: hypothetical protein NTX82_03320 [Candidatus Parcubacteria bacterium]|nr:hypothetical protein [Candidatus Parcubacteria bacterium]